MKNFISAVIITSLINGIPHIPETVLPFMTDEFSWKIYYLCTRFEVMIWLIFVFTCIPYGQLAAKSICGILIMQEIFDILTYAIYLNSNIELFYPLLILKIILYINWIIYICWRDYDCGNDELDNKHYFKISARPEGFQDFFLSLFNDPVGGTGIYVRGDYIHYRRGFLQVDDLKYLMYVKYKIRIKKMRPIDNDRELWLERILCGKWSKWTWVNNCCTVIHPILGKKGKPFF